MNSGTYRKQFRHYYTIINLLAFLSETRDILVFELETTLEYTANKQK